MQTITLGRTNLRVTRMGVGCGGPSRLGQQYGVSHETSLAVVREAIRAGVNFVDTADAYKTEPIVAEAIEGVPREWLVISTKNSFRGEKSEKAALEAVETSLARLGVEVIDIFHVHAPLAGDYPALRETIVPGLMKAREQGKIRFLGITERFSRDTDHGMLQAALRDEFWDVVMVGFSILNQSARETVLPAAWARRLGVLDMFAVRRALSRPDLLRDVVKQLIAAGEVSAEGIDPERPLDFLVEEGFAESIPDAAYRFCLQEPGVHVVLSGTGNPEHLRENLASFARPPLAPEAAARLRAIFAGVDSVSGS
jgi:aryl-alcohol dehydrogenase-like predicted oxidoreductase